MKGRYSYIKILFLSLVLLLSCNLTIAQDEYKVYGIIKTENGKKFHGEVVEYEPEQYVILNYKGEVMTFQLDNDNNTFKFTGRKGPKPYNFPVNTGYHRIAIGLLNGSPGDGGYLNYSYHHMRNRLFGYGGSLSFENYSDAQGYDFLVPSAVFYSYLMEQNATPFIRAHAGYGIAIKNVSKNQDEATGGLNAGVLFGYRLSTNKLMIDIGFGFRYQKGDYTFVTNEQTEIIKNEFKRLDFSVGFMW